MRAPEAAPPERLAPDARLPDDALDVMRRDAPRRTARQRAAKLRLQRVSDLESGDGVTFTNMSTLAFAESASCEERRRHFSSTKRKGQDIRGRVPGADT